MDSDSDPSIPLYVSLHAMRVMGALLFLLLVACASEGEPIEDLDGSGPTVTATLRPTFSPPIADGGTVPLAGTPWRIVQADREEPPAATASSLSPTDTPVPPTPVVYTVKAGDTLAAIAERFDVTVDALVAANDIPNPNSLAIGTALTIPVTAEASQVTQSGDDGTGGGDDASLTSEGEGGFSPDTTPLVIEVPEISDDATIHYVAEGETLSEIATQYTVTVDALLLANGLAEDVQLMAGEPLVIPMGTPTPAPTRTPSPAPIALSPTATPISVEALSEPSTAAMHPITPTATPTPVPATPTPIIYTVQQGDTPDRIAERYGVETEALLEANPGLDPQRMQVGDEIRIPSDADVPAPTATPTPTPANIVYREHVVQEGETLVDIAETYGIAVAVLTNANPSLEGEVPAVGTGLRVPVGTATPTPTATPVPTRTPTPGPVYLAPIPLMPKDGDALETSEPLLSWASTGILKENEAYVVRVRFLLDGEIVRAKSYRTRKTSLRLSTDLTPGLYLVRWNVLVVRQSISGLASGEAQSDLSNTAEFYLKLR